MCSRYFQFFSAYLCNTPLRYLRWSLAKLPLQMKSSYACVWCPNNITHDCNTYLCKLLITVRLMLLIKWARILILIICIKNIITLMAYILGVTFHQKRRYVFSVDMESPSLLCFSSSVPTCYLAEGKKIIKLFRSVYFLCNKMYVYNLNLVLADRILNITQYREEIPIGRETIFLNPLWVSP